VAHPAWASPTRSCCTRRPRPTTPPSRQRSPRGRRTRTRLTSFRPGQATTKAPMPPGGRRSQSNPLKPGGLPRPTRSGQWRAGGTRSGPSALPPTRQAELYDLGSKLRRSLSGRAPPRRVQAGPGRAKEDQVGAAELDRLAERHGHGGPTNCRPLALPRPRRRDRSQMQGIKDDEHRDIKDNTGAAQQPAAPQAAKTPARPAVRPRPRDCCGKQAQAVRARPGRGAVGRRPHPPRTTTPQADQHNELLKFDPQARRAWTSSAGARTSGSPVGRTTSGASTPSPRRPPACSPPGSASRPRPTGASTTSNFRPCSNRATSPG
jgi:hypothetical protein